MLEGKDWAEHHWYWQKIVMKLDLLGLSSNLFFALSIEADLKNSTKRVIYVNSEKTFSVWNKKKRCKKIEFFLQIDQPNLAIGREYLVKGFDDELVAAYYNYHVNTAVLYGAERFYAEIEAKNVLNFEMDLAKVSEQPSTQLPELT